LGWNLHTSTLCAFVIRQRTEDNNRSKTGIGTKYHLGQCCKVKRWRSWWFCCSWVVRLVCMVVVMVDVWVKVHLVVGVVMVEFLIVDVHLVAFMYDLAGSSAASSESASSLSERSVWRRKWRSG